MCAKKMADFRWLYNNKRTTKVHNQNYSQIQSFFEAKRIVKRILYKQIKKFGAKNKKEHKKCSFAF